MKLSRLSLLAVAGALTGLACGPSELPPEPSSQPVESSEAPIVGGTLTSGDPAVVAVTIRYGSSYESLCTGTLIGPKTVLTAAHCIYAYGQNLTYYVTFGGSSFQPTRAVQIVNQVKHPAYNQSAWDFGILRLAEPIAGVTPIPLNETTMTSAHVGRPIRHVGYGLTAANGSGSGIKREVTYNLRAVRQYTIESGGVGKQTCQGDSGGPAFMVMPGQTTESLVGVVSYGDPDCLSDGYDGRVDIVVPWIRSTMGAWEQPTCATDGACVPGCTPVDQDCLCVADGVCSPDCADPAMDADCPRDCATNGVCAASGCARPDADCIPLGGTCSVAAQCAGRLCINDPQNTATYCSQGCRQNSDCPTEMVCAAGACSKPQRPVRELFDSCYKSTDWCSQGVCTGPSGGITRCVKTCIVSGDCPSGSTCEAGADSQRFCRPSDLRFTNVTVPAVPLNTGTAAAGCSATGAGLTLWLLGVPLLLRRRARR